MTETERSRVVELQQQGYGYKKISTLTRLPLNTVKSFCTRHPVRDEEIAERQGLCRNCWRLLEQTPHHRKRRFCSDACRMAWWNAHPEKVNRRAYYKRVCKNCGREFASYGNDHRMFCSRLCYAQYRRKEVPK